MELKITKRSYDSSLIENNEHQHPILAKVFAARGVNMEAELDRPLSKLLPYKKLKGITTAISVLKDSMLNSEKIVVLGDFDTDGASSTALLLRSLNLFGYTNVDFIIPNRFDHGYGLTPKIAKQIVSTKSPDLVITVDNGISSIEGVDILKDKGIKVVITDHHLYSGELPKADAIVNPNQEGCEFESKNIAGVGVVFYFMAGLRRALHEDGWFEERGCPIPSMKEQLDLVALGTVADVVRLDANNRLLVHHGLEVIRKRKSKIGLSALLSLGRRDQSQILASDLSYCVGPRLNAAGRLNDMSIGVRCLVTENPVEADNIADKLNQLNLERRQIEIDMQEQAEEIIGHINFDVKTTCGICLHNPSWHQGVIGILASRVKEKYHRPTVIFTDSDENEIKGSCRSLAKLNIRDLLCEISLENPGVILKFGGHAMAAGLTVAKDKYDIFSHAFNKKISEKLTLDDLNSTIFTDGVLDKQYISLSFAKLIRQCGPWGQGFSEPIFEGEFDVLDQRIVGNNHLKLILSIDDFNSVNAIHFNTDLDKWPNESSKKVRLAYKLDINEYRGRQQVQLIVEDIKMCSVCELV
ncbi:MAG: single-stranded-DNA-specific exonuclease RecJ [Pseudomonadota bacterium]|nr:single-stranded-DNA-specific exonuclease RecJ [Pseudomonadota bacterium]